MKIDLLGVGDDGIHVTNGPDVAFTFDLGGQTFARWRVGGDIPAFKHPDPPRVGQPKPRQLAAGAYELVVQVSVMDLPSMSQTFDSTMRINGARVARVRGEMPKGQTEDRGVASFRLVVS
jgi:hypothetical protein